MKISFRWGDYSDRITSEQKVILEESMRTEISNTLEQMRNPPDELLVHLLPDPLCLSLKGAATNTAGATIVTITGSLVRPCTRSYSFFECSYADAE